MEQRHSLCRSFFCFLQRVREHTHTHTPLAWKDFQLFCKADWQFPSFFRAKGRSIHEVFNGVPERASKDVFKAGATEMLVVLPLIVYFAETFVAATLPKELESLRAIAVVAHETQEAKFQRGDVGRMLAAIANRFALFGETCSDEQVKPKHHYVCQLPRQLARDGFLVDAFTLERKHQGVKATASKTDNLGLRSLCAFESPH